jgi:hypothetical protein
MNTAVNPILIIPNQNSRAEEWALFYDVCKKRFGELAAKVAFANAWNSFNGQRPTADVLQVQKMTGLSLEESFFESAHHVGADVVDGIGGALRSTGTGLKAVFIGGMVLIIGAGVVILYRAFTATAQEIGTVAGIAAKTYTGR